VRTCSALSGDGLPEAWQLIEAYAAQTQASGYWQQRRAHQQLQWLEAAVRQALEAQFYGRVGVQQALPEVRQAVAAGQLTPWAAAGKLLDS
jgi:LAO/AO transport system kinase